MVVWRKNYLSGDHWGVGAGFVYQINLNRLQVWGSEVLVGGPRTVASARGVCPWRPVDMFSGRSVSSRQEHLRSTRNEMTCFLNRVLSAEHYREINGLQKKREHHRTPHREEKKHKRLREKSYGSSSHTKRQFTALQSTQTDTFMASKGRTRSTKPIIWTWRTLRWKEEKDCKRKVTQ